MQFMVGRKQKAARRRRRLKMGIGDRQQPIEERIPTTFLISLCHRLSLLPGRQERKPKNHPQKTQKFRRTPITTRMSFCRRRLEPLTFREEFLSAQKERRTKRCQTCCRPAGKTITTCRPTTTRVFQDVGLPWRWRQRSSLKCYRLSRTTPR